MPQLKNTPGDRQSIYLASTAPIFEENLLVCIRREVFATKDKGKIVEQAALSDYSVNMGVDRCHVNFLPHAYVQMTGTLFDGVLCQASLFNASSYDFFMQCMIRLPSSNLSCRSRLGDQHCSQRL
jgi:hypothetical protein